jgi:Dyp-type peroxidase family
MKALQENPVTATLNLHDIQGNIVKGYGRFGFPFARYVFFEIKDSAAGRKFITSVTPLVTNSAPWKENTKNKKGLDKPSFTVNIALTYHGLKKLGLPEVSLHSFPRDFSGGMRQRQDILGDDGNSAPHKWDKVWRNPDHRVCILIALNGQTKASIEESYELILSKLNGIGGGVAILCGHSDGKQDDLPYQDAAALMDENNQPTGKEHFGYNDGISNPFFKGTGQNPLYAVGNGKPTRRAANSPLGWEALEAGEFILGHKDESLGLPPAPIPHLLSYNGTFMVYRKLHQNVGSFYSYLKEQANQHPEKCEEFIAAKFAGRWRNGAPITLFPTQEEANAVVAELEAAKIAMRKARGTIDHTLAELNYLRLLGKFVGFDYNDDLDGSRCPVGAHIRRSNPRSSLEFGIKDAYNTPGALSNRRRLLRRGLPYGSSTDKTVDTGNHGIIFMAICSDISRQFEFTQQQWGNYGNDFKLANDKDPLTGNHNNKEADGRMIFPAEKGSGKAPYFCTHIPRFVETRGGEYFFVPSITALRLIGEGLVDPT